MKAEVQSFIHFILNKYIYIYLCNTHLSLSIWDSISCGRGFQCSLITEKANSSYCTDWF